jgi:hypothetical protein
LALRPATSSRSQCAEGLRRVNIQEADSLRSEGNRVPVDDDGLTPIEGLRNGRQDKKARNVEDPPGKAAFHDFVFEVIQRILAAPGALYFPFLLH